MRTSKYAIALAVDYRVHGRKLCAVTRAGAGRPRSYVARVMSAFQVPAVSLAVVKDGQVVVSKGYGVRKLGESTPADGKTLFGIASNTKLFTATALGLLVEGGQIEWDAPVVRYLPWFQMWDP